MTNESRRNFNKLMGTAVAIVPLTQLAAILPARADDLPLVDPESPAAAGLQYMVVSEVDGQQCANCTLYTADDGAQVGKCPLFAGQQVPAEAWCSAWVIKG